MKTYNAVDIGLVLSGVEVDKPVYMKCAYNHYRITKIVDKGDYYLLESPEDDGCWMPADSIRQEVQEVQEEKPVKVSYVDGDDGPILA